MTQSRLIMRAFWLRSFFPRFSKIFQVLQLSRATFHNTFSFSESRPDDDHMSSYQCYYSPYHCLCLCCQPLLGTGRWKRDDTNMRHLKSLRYMSCLVINCLVFVLPVLTRLSYALSFHRVLLVVLSCDCLAVLYHLWS